MNHTSRLAALLLAGGLAFAACGDDGGSTEAQPSANADRVTMEKSVFTPIEFSIAAGESVDFVNLDPFAHTVTSTDASPLEFDSGNLGGDETFTQTFDEAGTYAYLCEIHPTMRASIIVS